MIAIDLLEMSEISGVNFAQLDFLKEDAPEKLLAMMDGRADVVLSDMAANTTGHRKTDQLRILGLVEGAAAFAADVLKPGGTFVAKVFQSGADATLMTELKRDFATVKHVKPASSRKDFPSAMYWRWDFGARKQSRHPRRQEKPDETRVACSIDVQAGCGALSMVGAASAADVHVMISAGFYGVYSELGPAFERASGHHLVTTRGPSMGDSPEAIPARLARGEAADVVILDGGAADELGKRGLVRADSKIEFARSLIGMVVRAGAAKPDIGSVEAFRSTLLAAKSIAYSDSGSGTYLSIDSVREARRRRPDRGQEPKGARTTVRRAGGRGCRAWRGGDRLPAGQPS